MTHESIRRMLRTSGVTMSILQGKPSDFRIPSGLMPELFALLTERRPSDWRLSPSEKRLHTGLEPFRNAGDLIRWADIEVRSRLGRALGQGIPQASERGLVFEALLRGVLVECLLVECLAEQSLLPTLKAQFESLQTVLPTSDNPLLDDLAGHYESRDIRRIVLTLSPLVCGLEGRELMERLGLGFPDRPVAISPAWVRRHQREDRPNQYWFYHSLQGRGLFLVLYTRKCGFGACTGCSLHTLGCNDFIPNPAIMKQVSTCLDYELTQLERASIREVMLSNNGSVFDPRAMPVAALLFACAAAVDRLPQLKRIVFETRAEFVKSETLQLLRETLDASGRAIEMEVAIGVELFDERLRNKAYRKGLTDATLRTAIRHAAQAGSGLRCYFMYRPLPGMTPATAAEDIRKALGFLDEIASTSKSEITMHINPTYVASDTPLEEAFRRGEYEPVDLDEVEALLATLSGHRVTLYVGLNDEGLAIPGGSFLKPGCEESLARLKRFNRTQDFSALDATGPGARVLAADRAEDDHVGTAERGTGRAATDPHTS